MSQFRPGFWTSAGSCGLSEYCSFDTYEKCISKVKQLLRDGYEKQLSISRSKRGEWGEYFENWELVNNKPTIVKEGWM